jgi:hypothetical protein
LCQNVLYHVGNCVSLCQYGEGSLLVTISLFLDNNSFLGAMNMMISKEDDCFVDSHNCS